MTNQEAIWILMMMCERDAKTQAERDAFEKAINALLEKAKITQKTGEWIPWMMNDDKYAYGNIVICRCSACMTPSDRRTNYCPQCGADMKEKKDE